MLSLLRIFFLALAVLYTSHAAPLSPLAPTATPIAARQTDAVMDVPPAAIEFSGQHLGRVQVRNEIVKCHTGGASSGGAYLFEVKDDGTVVGTLPEFCRSEKLCRQLTHWDDYGFKYVPPECKEYHKKGV